MIEKQMRLNAQAYAAKAGNRRTRRCSGHIGSNAELVVLNKVLLDQGIVLVKLAELALGNALDHFLGLAFLAHQVASNF